jgi:hypothetical protein
MDQSIKEKFTRIAAKMAAFEFKATLEGNRLSIAAADFTF